MPDAVAGLDLVDRASAVLEQAIGLRPDAVEIFARIAARVVVDLHFEAGDHGLPGRIPSDQRMARSGYAPSGRSVRSSVGRGNRRKTPLLWLRRIENAELQAQREIGELLRGVVQKPQPPVAVAHHLAVEVEHAATSGPARRQFLNVAAVPSNSGRKPASDCGLTIGSGPGSTLPLSRSPVRRPSATPVSIGFGEPTVGKSAGPAT